MVSSRRAHGRARRQSTATKIVFQQLSQDKCGYLGGGHALASLYRPANSGKVEARRVAAHDVLPAAFWCFPRPMTHGNGLRFPCMAFPYRLLMLVRDSRAHAHMHLAGQAAVGTAPCESRGRKPAIFKVLQHNCLPCCCRAQRTISLPQHRRGCHIITNKIYEAVPEIAEYEVGRCCVINAGCVSRCV